MTPQEFSTAAKELLSRIVDCSGAVLYSPASTLREGKYYFLGLNPGGIGGLSIGEHLSNLPSINTNSYVDEEWDWGSGNLREAGAHPLQRNAKEVFCLLGVDIGDICASNIIFVRSPGESDCGYPRRAEECWPVHELILGVVKPKVIITYGRRPFEFVSKKLNASRLKDFPSGHGGWVCREAVGEGVTILGLPHLSRYTLNGKEEVKRWLRERAGLI